MTLRDPVTFATEDHRSHYPSVDMVTIYIDGTYLEFEYVRDLVHSRRCAVVAVSCAIPPGLYRSVRSRTKLIQECRKRFIRITGMKPDYLRDYLLDALSGTGT